MRAARTVSPIPSGRVLPSSRDSRRPIASLRSRISDPALSSTSNRTSGEASAQPSKASRAALTA